MKYLNHHMSKFTFVFICVLVFNSAVNAKEHSSVKEISELIELKNINDQNKRIIKEKVSKLLFTLRK